MNQQQIKEILKDAVFMSDNSLRNFEPFLAWNIGSDSVCLDGYFDADELEAIAWWMKNVNRKGFE